MLQTRHVSQRWWGCCPQIYVDMMGWQHECGSLTGDWYAAQWTIATVHAITRPQQQQV